jgi:membrane peptidoglycan carboxypeptidase
MREQLADWFRTSWIAKWLVIAFFCSLLALLILNEVFQSTIQSLYLSYFTSKLKYEIVDGTSSNVAFGANGPFDQRLGYSKLDALVKSAVNNDYQVKKQASLTDDHIQIIKKGIFPIYIEKSQTGLRLYDKDEKIFYQSLYPTKVYASFSEIPSLVVKTLLFIENRELLDNRYPGRNPAVEWDRFGKAIVDLGLKLVKPSHKVAGGSTLATQIEKFRHSPEGRTTGAKEKLRQMVSASLRAYLQGSDTTKARERITLEYINSIPLSAIPLYGEVNGLGDGLLAWYGRGFDEVNALVKKCATGDITADCALAYKQTLSLFVAQRRPSYYLGKKPDYLDRLTNTYLRLLEKEKIISRKIANLASDQVLKINKLKATENWQQFVARKADNRVRTRLLQIFNIPSLYEMDRFDIEASTALNTDLQYSVTKTLLKLQEDAFVKEQGLRSEYLLNTTAPLKDIVYSFTLYEKGKDANLLRVTTDNYNQPLNINQGVKLDLGSTAKLRTLVTYLEIIAELYHKFKSQNNLSAREYKISNADKISNWVREYLVENPNISLRDTLLASLERQYSASPAERFFTGGGIHTFANFKREDNGKVLSIKEAMRHSVNLPFIRLMRDISQYYIYSNVDDIDQIFNDPNNQKRIEYLEKFADQEGRLFQRRFYKKHKGKHANEIISSLLASVTRTPKRYSAVLRALNPTMSEQEFALQLGQALPEMKLTNNDAKKYYQQVAGGLSNLADRGYIAHIHPLELWTADYLMKRPHADLKEVFEKSRMVRIEVYKWLIQSKHKEAQNSRIKSVLETEAFVRIHKAWKKLGYAFDYLVPSYASAIGSSADRPAALADLMGIIVNDGIKKPTVLIGDIKFAKDTPYETHFKLNNQNSKQVLEPEIAKVLKEVLADIVENGTARRIKGSFDTEDGTVVTVGGKTGTGDHRYEVYSSGGGLVSSKVVNRTATFVFYIGDKYFGTVVAYVAGEKAGRYKFTSALPVQILKIISNELKKEGLNTYKTSKTSE